MADVPAPTEILQNLPDLDVNKYNLWRDWSYNLMLGEAKMPGVEKSDRFGRALHFIGEKTVKELREGRKRNGNPYIVLTDEKDDNQVLTEASSGDIEVAFIDAVFKQLKGWVSGETEQEREYYPTATLALGSALLKKSPENVKSLVLGKIKDAKIHPAKDKALTVALEKVSMNKVDKITQYLKFSQTQMTNSESYLITTGRKEPLQPGSEPFTLGDDTYEFVGGKPGGTVLATEDENILIPLMAANHRSRKEMIEQAKEAARQVFDMRDEEMSNPPSWWQKGDGGEDISSKQVLVLFPYSAEVDEEKIPIMYREILKSSRGRRGWFLVEIDNQSSPWLMTGSVGKMSD